jgi:F-type H+-transporting ATPase subunit b
MLEIDISTVLFQILNFLILAGALYWFLFRPVMANVTARATEKEQLMATLREDREAATVLRAELESQRARAEEEATVVISEARDQAAIEHAALLEEAQGEVERVLTEAHADAYRIRQQAVDEFHEELLNAISDVSGLVIGQIAPQELHDTLVKQLYDRIWELGRSEMQRVEMLRASLGDRAPTVVVRSARELSREQQGHLVRTFTALADRNVNLDLQTEPALGLGMHVRIGDLIVDNSVVGKLEGLHESVSSALRDRIRDQRLRREQEANA